MRLVLKCSALKKIVWRASLGKRTDDYLTEIDEEYNAFSPCRLIYWVPYLKERMKTWPIQRTGPIAARFEESLSCH